MPSSTDIFASALSYVSRKPQDCSYSSHNNGNNGNNKDRLYTPTLASITSHTVASVSDIHTYDRASGLNHNYSDQSLPSSEAGQNNHTSTTTNMTSTSVRSVWPQPPKLPAPLQKPYMRVDGDDVIISPELEAHLRLLERDYTNYNHLAAFREALSLAVHAANLETGELPRSGHASGHASSMVASHRSSLGGRSSAHSYPNDKTSGLEVPTSRRRRNSAGSAGGGVSTANGALPSSTLKSRLRNWSRLHNRRNLRDSLMGAVRPKKRSRQARASSITYMLLRFPLFLAILCVVLLELFIYFLIRQIVNVWEYFFTW
jgi:hypothetical protein